MGRRGLFDGEREKISVKLTLDAMASLRAVREWLETRHGHAATDAGAVEFLIRRATHMPFDANVPGSQDYEEFDAWLARYSAKQRRRRAAAPVVSARAQKAARKKRMAEATSNVRAGKVLQRVKALVASLET